MPVRNKIVLGTRRRGQNVADRSRRSKYAIAGGKARGKGCPASLHVDATPCNTTSYAGKGVARYSW